MSELRKTYENVKMSLVGAMNLSFDALDKEIQKILVENQAKDQRIKELEEKLKGE